jgi:DNA polymerase-3 subunit gamma/tau
MDAASESGVDDIREQIVEAVEYRPMICRYKIFIIDEVHDLSSKAFDALLKTVEEPPAHIIFILATTEYNKVPPTIRSRCQKHEFRRASIQDLIGRLDYVLSEEKMEAEPAAVAAIARMADGGYRDALTLLEQVMLVADGKVTLEQIYDQLGLVGEDTIDAIFRAIGQHDVVAMVERLDQVNEAGKDSRALLESMMYRLADLTRASYNVQDRNLDAARDASLHETAVTLGRDLILRLRADVAEAHKLIRDISLPRIWLESRLVTLAVADPVLKPQASVRARTQPATAVYDPKKGDKPTEPVENKSTVVAEDDEPTAPASVSEPASTGDPDLDEAVHAWHKSKLNLGKLSPTLRMRLETATVLAREGLSVTIQLERHGDHDWIVEGKKKPAEAIAREFRNNFHPEGQLQYVVKKKGGPAIGPSMGEEAVELPLEGSLLEQAVKQVFS